MRALAFLMVVAAGACSGSGRHGSGAGTGRVFVALSSSGSMSLPQRCDADGVCPAGKICFRLTPDLAVCDVPQQAVATTCSWDTDECECDGRMCGGGTVCVTTIQSAHFYNVCLQPACSSPGDCTGDSVCTPASLIVGRAAADASGGSSTGRCFTPRCKRDVVCSAGANGVCALVLVDGQFGERYMEKVGCVYPGDAASATACAPDQATALRDPAAPAQSYYTCPETWATQSL
jgi:hypothetical protein